MPPEPRRCYALLITFVLVDDTTETLPLHQVPMDDTPGQPYLVQVHAQDSAEATRNAWLTVRRRRFTHGRLIG
jgi:hypothetical protein